MSKNTAYSLLFILTLLFSALLLSCSDNSNNKHYCNWEDCEHQGEIMDQQAFTAKWGPDEGTDAFYCELTHFMNPEMSYEECEDYVFSGVE